MVLGALRFRPRAVCGFSGVATTFGTSKKPQIWHRKRIYAVICRGVGAHASVLRPLASAPIAPRLVSRACAIAGRNGSITEATARETKPREASSELELKLQITLICTDRATGGDRAFLVALIRHASADDPGDRPSFAELVAAIDRRLDA